MYKYMILMKKKASISREEFIDYYENQHVPLMRAMAGEKSTGATTSCSTIRCSI